MTASSIEILGTLCFALAIIHTFSTNYFLNKAIQFKTHSIKQNLFHLLGEVEVVFGLWSAIFVVFYSLIVGLKIFDSTGVLIGGAFHYLESQNYTEPLFVFVIMCMAATRPIISLASRIVLWFSKIIPLSEEMAFYISALIIGPLLGSLITEPAAMTVTALILLQYIYQSKKSLKFKYATLGLLFVNISIGGTLTHFAAPPVLMVAHKFNWDTLFMLKNFGWKALVAIFVSTMVYALFFKEELKGKIKTKAQDQQMNSPWWIYLIHVGFLSAVVFSSHHPVVFLSLFLFFIAFVMITEKYQDALKIKESLLVGFFLAGLVVLGSIQKWWLQDVLLNMNDLVLYFGAAGLTAITDNAALTYLGSLVPLSDQAQYYLVAGAVTGGGLTVIANAPNPAGYGILKQAFPKSNIKMLSLFLWSLIPTGISALCFLLLP